MFFGGPPPLGPQANWMRGFLIVTSRHSVGKREVALLVPPDVLAAAIDQLELEGVRRRVATHEEFESVVSRQRERERLAGDHITAAAEVEVDAQAHAGVAGVACDLDARAV